MKSMMVFLFAALLASTAHAQSPQSLGTGNGAATLSWIAPTANTDGTADTTLCGFNIYEASTTAALAALPNSLNGGKPLASPFYNVTSWSFIGMVSGSYYFAVTALNCLNGVTTESAQSSAALVTIVVPPTAKPPSGVAVTATVSVSTL